ncbi:MAG: sterol carrier family protein [Winkia neuii]|nr:sterol carrier family protein [Winkia neuii]
MRRRISDEDGLAALRQWWQITAAARAEGDFDSLRQATKTMDRKQRRAAVRWSLEEFAELYPGRSVEVRVPPAAAVQAIAGTVHRRGTPPAVVECDETTWLAMATGIYQFGEAVAAGRVTASGIRTDLSSRLPLHLPRLA